MPSNLLHFLFLQKKENNVQYLLPDEKLCNFLCQIINFENIFHLSKNLFLPNNLCYVLMQKNAAKHNENEYLLISN